MLGSLVSSAYRSTMASSVGGLPPAAAAVARDSIGGAYGVAKGAGAAGTQLNALAATAFTDAMSTALVAAAVVALITAGIVLVFFPRTTPALIAPDGRTLDPNRPDDEAAPGGASHGG